MPLLGVAELDDARQPRLEGALEDARRLAREAAHQTDNQRTEQTEQRRCEAGRHALQGFFQRAEQLAERARRRTAAGRFGERADDAADRAHHVQQADKRSDQAHEHQQAREVDDKRLLVVDRLFDLVDQRIHGLERDSHLLGARELLGDEIVGVAEKAGTAEHQARLRTAIVEPQRIARRFLRRTANIVRHFL